MRQALPPLNGLRAFEAAARLGNLVKAGEELHVTPSAVGHQIRSLETYLGVRLFDRKAKRLTLTTTGKRFAEMLTQGFDLLHRATSAIRRESSARAITVSATPALALRWLAPALDQLRQEGIAEFRIDASSREADLFAGEADLDIRYGRTVEEGLVADVLFSEAVFPVCHPDYASKLSLRRPHDVLRGELLFVDDWAHRGGVWSAWRDWLEEAGVEFGTLTEAARYSELDKAVEAAAGGSGVAIGAQRHLDRWGRADRHGHQLVRPFDDTLSVRYSSTLVALPEIAEDRTIRKLRRRLVALAAEHPNILHQGAF